MSRARVQSVIEGGIASAIAEELLQRIDEIKNKINNVGSDDERNACWNEILKLCDAVSEIKTKRDEQAALRPDYLDDLRDFPELKTLFENIDSYYQTCFKLKNLMRNESSSLVFSARRSTRPQAAASRPEETNSAPSLFSPPRRSERLKEKNERQSNSYKF